MKTDAFPLIALPSQAVFGLWDLFPLIPSARVDSPLTQLRLAFDSGSIYFGNHHSHSPLPHF